MSEYSSQIWFITGATRGLGQQIAKAALAKGDKVVATGRNLHSLQQAFPANERLLLLPLDITDAEQIATAVNSAKSHFGRLDILVNNAGYGQLGIFEEITAPQIVAQFNTNVFALFAVTKAVLPVMRQQRSGKIFNFSSIGGVFGVAGASIYCASKFAVEGFSESLAEEVAQFGISVTIVEPGYFRTDFLEPQSVSFGQLQLADYLQYSSALDNSYKAHSHQQAGDPAKLGAAIVELASTTEPPLHFAVGSDALQAIAATYQKRSAELTAWQVLSGSTDF